MEKYCISLPQAKRLVELGFERESQWGWANDAPFGKDKWYVTNYNPAFLYPAYHVGELGEILPARIEDYYLIIEKNVGEWYCWYDNDTNSGFDFIREKTEAQARGRLLIYLLENGLI